MCLPSSLNLLAQGISPVTAAVSGVFLHGTAGDLAAVYRSEESMIASDMIEMLGKAFKRRLEIIKSKNGNQFSTDYLNFTLASLKK